MHYSFQMKSEAADMFIHLNLFPEILRFLKQISSLNPKLKERITLVPFPIAETSGQNLFYSDCWTRKQSDTASKRITCQNVQTISIDDFCQIV